MKITFLEAIGDLSPQKPKKSFIRSTSSVKGVMVDLVFLSPLNSGKGIKTKRKKKKEGQKVRNVQTVFQNTKYISRYLVCFK
jgi:hypothetical protein